MTVGAWVRLRAVGRVLHLHTGAENAHARREVGQRRKTLMFVLRLTHWRFTTIGVG